MRAAGIMFSVSLVALSAGLALLAPNAARAERSDDEPMFQRLGMHYLSLVKHAAEPFETGFHAGGFFDYTNRLYWRDFKLTDKDLNFQAGGFVQFAGFRLEGHGSWSDPFASTKNGVNTDLAHPAYWDINLNYLLQVERSMMVIGVRRNNFSTLPDRANTEFPLFLDEVYLKIIAVPEPLQQEVNFMYTVGLHQRFSGGRDGLLVDVGFQTISTNAWVLGDVLSLSGKLTYNHRFLQPYGRFSTYQFAIKLLKDVSNVSDPGRGPIWLELIAIWNGAISSRYKDDATITVGLWAVF